MLCLASFCSLSSNAEDITTGNLINNNNWTGGIVYGVDPNDCCTSVSGANALYDTSTDTIKFSYGLATVYQTIGIQQALGGTGLKISGYNYSFDYRLVGNNSVSSDALTASIWMTASNGFNTEVTHLYLGDSVGPGFNDYWKSVWGSRLFTSPLLDPQSITMRIEGRDNGFWAGYYGPEVKNVNLSVNYSADQCAINPLSSTSCPGYEQAYFNMQCSNNALYSTSCPGYFEAWVLQVCSASPLADLLCPGYQQAYFEQQCTANQLHSPSCPGYGAAMAAKLESEKKTEEKSSPIVQPQETSIASSIEDSTKEPTRTDVGGIETTTTGEIVVPDGIPQVVKESTVEKEKKSAGAPTSLIMSMLRNEREKEQRLALDVAAKAEKESMSENANPSDGIGYGVDPRTAGVGLQIPGSIQNSNQQQETQNQENTKLNSNIATMDNGEQRQQNISNESNKQPQGLRRKGEPNDMDSNTTIAALVQSPVGFESYLRGNLTDGQMYAPKEIYKNQRVVDNARLERILNLQSDIRYEELVNQQYELAK